MVRRLVHEQAAGMRRQRVPAAEIVGAVLDVEIPVEIDRGDVADDTRQQQFLDGAGGRREAVVEGDVDAPPGAALGIEDPAARRGRRCHRLFADHVDAGLERADDQVGMGIVAAGDDQRVGPRRCQHLGAVGKDRRVDADRRPRPFQPHRVAVAKPDELDPFAAIGEQLLAPCAGAAMAGADQRDAPLSPERHQAAFRMAPPGTHSPCACRRSSTRSDISSSDSSAAVCGSSMAACLA